MEDPSSVWDFRWEALDNCSGSAEREDGGEESVYGNWTLWRGGARAFGERET